MDQDIGSAGSGIIFHSVNSNIAAGNDIHLVNVTVNNTESSILTRLKTSLNPVTSASYDSYEAKQRSECFPNTRVKVLNDIEAWIHSKSHQPPIYVLDGVAGIGKSTIAQTIATRAAALGLLGASFFFSRDEDLRKVARHFFPTIAYQLGCYDSQFATRICCSLDQNPDAPSKRLYQQLLLLLLEPLGNLLPQRARPMLIVIDAIDECEEENAEELLSLLGQYIHRMSGLKVLITTRPEAHLRSVFEEDQNHQKFCLHEIEDSIVHSDIRLYLESRLSQEEIRKASRSRRSIWQPRAKEMDMLCGICGTLFIIAATAIKFILDRRQLSPEKQLARLLDGVAVPGFAGSKHTNVLDETYLRILLAARPQPDFDYESDEVWFKDLNKVLGALVALSTPLPLNALASLVDIGPEDIEATLSQLHSLIAPTGSEENTTFRIHHKSFPDFITDRERIRYVLRDWQLRTHLELDRLLWIDILDHHMQLAKACFRIMNRDLKRNIADISKEDWYEDKANIPHVVPELISPDLRYASLYWASHLRCACGLGKDPELQIYLHEWASRHILAWIEVMIILDQAHEIYEILKGAIESMKLVTEVAWKERERTQELLLDTHRFAQQGIEVMKLSPMHIYRSCLPFIPAETSLYKTYGQCETLKIGLGRNHQQQWNLPLLATMIGHSSVPGSVVFSSDGSRIASGSHDNTIRLWDAEMGAHVSTFLGHSGPVLSVVFSIDGSKIASGSTDKTIRLWHTRTSAHISTILGHSGAITSVAFSRDGSRLASGSDDKTIQLWSPDTGTHVLTLSGHLECVNSVSFSNDDTRLASGGDDSIILLWNSKTGARISTLTGHLDRINSVIFSSDGSQLASGSWDHTIRLWDVETGACISTLTGHSSWIASVAFSGDGSRLASGAFDGTIRLWDAKTGLHMSTLTGHSRPVVSVAFSMNGSRLASGSYDGTVRLWDAETGPQMLTTTGHSLLTLVTSVAFSNDGSRLASGSNEKTILWDAKAGVPIANYSSRAQSLGFSNDGSRLACGCFKSVQIWDIETAANVFTFTGHSQTVTTVVFSNDDSLLATGSLDNTIQLWDTNTGSRICTLTDHSDWVYSIAFSNDGFQLLSGSRDGSIRLWDVNKGSHLCALHGHTNSVFSVAFSGDGSLLISIDYVNTIRVWDAKTSMQIFTFLAPFNSMRIQSLVFLRDISQIVQQVVPTKSQLVQHKITDPIPLLLLVTRDDPPITGIVMARILPEAEDSWSWEVTPACWFPPNLRAECIAFSSTNSQLAVGCESGRVLLLDTSEFSVLNNQL